MTSIGILIFDDVELFDIAAVQAAFVAQREFRCHLLSSALRPVRARGGIKLLPDCVLPPAGDLDALVLAGGQSPADGSALLCWLAARPDDTQAIAAIGAGRVLLARAGVQNRPDRTDCAKVLTSESGSDAIALGLQLRAQLTRTDLQARYFRREADESARRPAAAGVFPAA